MIHYITGVMPGVSTTVFLYVYDTNYVHSLRAPFRRRTVDRGCCQPPGKHSVKAAEV